MSDNGEIHITKECSEYTGLAGSFCTITSSNVDAIPVGAKVVYAAGADGVTLDSDIVVESADGGSINGHVVLDLATNVGTVTILGGSGDLAGLRADTAVTYDGTEWHWDGTYSLSPAGV